MYNYTPYTSLGATNMARAITLIPFAITHSVSGTYLECHVITGGSELGMQAALSG